jgi:dTDP-4-dehydrorhamnose 3,5-epimerase-like enzyme
MNVTPLNIDGSWIIELKKFEDSRGFFYKCSLNEIIKKHYGTKNKINESNTTLIYKISVTDFHYALTPPCPIY